MTDNNYLYRLKTQIEKTFPKVAILLYDKWGDMACDALSEENIRARVNHLLWMHLTTLEVDTITIRLFLNAHDNFEFWHLSLFRTVLPFIEANMPSGSKQ